MATYLPDVHHAKEELARLHSIRAYLANQIIACKTDYVTLKSAEAWVKMYQARLRDNVLPAIKECEDYIKSHT